MSNKLLRQALNLAIDRDLLSKALWGGEALVLNGHQLEEWGELFDPARPKTPFDPQRAAELVKASGYKGEEVVFQTHPVYYTNGLEAAQAIVEMWRKVGINARVQVNEKWASLGKDDPALMVRNLSDWQIVSDPEATIHWSWTTTAFWQGDGAKRFDALGAEARATFDNAQRAATYREMLDIFDDDAPGTVLYRAREFYGVRNGIRWQPYTLYTTDFRASNLAFE